MSYGVQPRGFVKKPLTQIMTEIEQGIASEEVLGPDVIQDAQSPQGQINGLFGYLASQLWELAEAVYQSYDVDQGENGRLDNLGKIRGLTRQPGEPDHELRPRITNTGRPDIHMMPVLNAIRAVSGVTCVNYTENKTDDVDDDGVPGHSLSFSVVGGADEDVAQAIYDYTTAGIGLHGNTFVDLTVESGCERVQFMRPTLIPISLALVLRAEPIACACRAPSQSEVAAHLVAGLQCEGFCGVRNGQDIDQVLINAVGSSLEGFELISALGSRKPAVPEALPVTINFDELATFLASDISVSYQ